MLAKARRLRWAQRGALLEALFWLGLARLVLLVVPFRRIAPWLGRQMAQTEEGATPHEEALAQEIGRVVRTAARRTPWESACLAQAISARAMLRRRGVASTLYLGLARGEAGALQAHAWLRCGTAVVTGGDYSDYTVMASFTR